MVILAGALAAGHAVEGGFAVATVDQAGEQVGGSRPARVPLGGGNRFPPGVKRDEALDGVPGGKVNERGTIVCDGQIPKFQNADVDAIGEEGAEGVDGGKEAGLFEDGGEGLPSGAHGECLADAREEIRIGDPAMGDARGVVSVLADGDRGAFEASGRCAGDASVFLDKFAQAALGVDAGLAAFLFIGEIDEEFNDAAIVAFRDGIAEGVNSDLVGAQKGFVVDSVVEVPGEAGVIPEDETCRALFGNPVGVDHAIEVVAANGRAARFGFVHEVVTEDEAVARTIFLDLRQLLVCGLLLTATAAVAAV